MDPEVSRYFKKIINSFSWGLIWLLTVSTAGIFFELALIPGTLRWYNLAFYLVAAFSLAMLIRYFYRMWK